MKIQYISSNGQAFNSFEACQEAELLDQQNGQEIRTLVKKISQKMGFEDVESNSQRITQVALGILGYKKEFRKALCEVEK